MTWRTLWAITGLPRWTTLWPYWPRLRRRGWFSPGAGKVKWLVSIGDEVAAGDPLGSVGSSTIAAPFDGVVRGLLADGQVVGAGLKIADVDPRGDPSAAFEISDKALAVGGGVLEAVMTWLNR